MFTWAPPLALLAVLIGCGRKADDTPMAGSSGSSKPVADTAQARSAMFLRATGTALASPGELFGDLKPGDALVRFDELRTQLRPVLDKEMKPISLGSAKGYLKDVPLEVLVFADDAQITSFGISGADECPPQLESTLTQRWQVGHTYADHRVWLDPVTKLRANLSREAGECSIRFDRYVMLDDWIKELPLDLVGTSSVQLLQKLGPRADNRTINIYWSSLGVEVGSLNTDFNAMLEGEVVTSFSVTTGVGRETADKIIARLTSILGPPHPDHPTFWTRPNGPLIVMYGDGDLTIQAGAIVTHRP